MFTWWLTWLHYPAKLAAAAVTVNFSPLAAELGHDSGGTSEVTMLFYGILALELDKAEAVKR